MAPIVVHLHTFSYPLQISIFCFPYAQQEIQQQIGLCKDFIFI